MRARRPPPVPTAELRLRGQRHTISRDRRAVRHHYDVGNEFFALFLDRSMTYSCAYFAGGAETLEEAQEAKVELVCKKLGLREGERVLDVGCGWGSFVIHAATHYGVRAVGITLAERQAELARERVREAGVADRVEIRVADYREVSDGPFDAIASIGMVEHVGAEQIDVYAKRLHGLLKPGGGCSTTGSPSSRTSIRRTRARSRSGSCSRTAFLCRSHGSSKHWSASSSRRPTSRGSRPTTRETITYWIERFDAHWDDAVRLAGIERARIWRLYLRAARQGFDDRVGVGLPGSRSPLTGNVALGVGPSSLSR